MTRDDIIRIAKEASVPMPIDEWIADFANLVAAAEREACVNAVSHALYGQNGCGKAIDAIRARGQG